MSESAFARVAVPRPLDQTFLYRVPAELEGHITPGSRVIVPFGRRELVAWVDELLDESPGDAPSRIRPIIDTPDDRPVLEPEILELCRWVSRYYVAPPGMTFRAALPAALTDESSERLLRRPVSAEGELNEAERRLLVYLEGRTGPVKLRTARKALGTGSWGRVARDLAERGLIELRHEGPDVSPPVRSQQVIEISRGLPSLTERDELFGRAKRQRELYEYLESVGGRAPVTHVVEQLGISRSVVHGLADRGVARLYEEEVSADPLAGTPAPPAAATPPLPPLTPTPAQCGAIETLLAASDERDPGVFLLKGVTGSGKTLVYIEVLKELVSKRGGGAILLVPEISLTPQTLNRFRAAFGDQVAVLHSALSEGERFASWEAVRSGEKRIVVGARSAVFAPVPDLAVIVLDEEHEGSYKQNDPAPRYHAREVAVVRAHAAGALCLLGSATPSLETWENARSGKWGFIELPERIGARPLPQVEIIDLRQERQAAREARAGNGRPAHPGPLIFSSPLEHALSQRLVRREQAILLLNRRGYATFVQCRDCGVVRACRRCNVSLTQHRRPQRLVCHYCNHQEPLPESCGECGSENLSFRGVGTEQVERALGELFPDARIARMDVDTTSAKWSHHEILARVERGEIDVLLGTQMIAKGLDFPNVTLVGVINADVGLNIPDFRASERTFQLLTQVAGRAGRGPGSGEVIIQSALPGHYAIQFAVSHDYDGFAERELEERREPAYPPFVRLANVVFSGRSERIVQETASAAADWIEGLVRARDIPHLEIVGPAPCPIDRLRGRWRWHLLLKGDEPAPLGRVLEFFARKFEPPSAGDTRVEIDRDPSNLL